MIDCLVNSSMITADIRDQSRQQEWRESLTRVIQQGSHVVLLIDAVDEMKTVEREEFLYYIDSMLPTIPGKQFQIIRRQATNTTVQGQFKMSTSLL